MNLHVLGYNRIRRKKTTHIRTPNTYTDLAKLHHQPQDRQAGSNILFASISLEDHSSIMPLILSANVHCHRVYVGTEDHGCLKCQNETSISTNVMRYGKRKMGKGKLLFTFYSNTHKARSGLITFSKVSTVCCKREC